MRVMQAEAEALAARALVAAGASDDAAEDTARILTMAEMMGTGTHGLLRVAQYVERMRTGGIDAAAQIVVSRPAPALCHVEGADGLGPAVAMRGLRSATDAARLTGLAASFCRGAGHAGALAPYLWIAAEAGFVCLCTTNTAPMIAPAGGRSARIGNNPLGIGLPHPDGRHVMLDMALSTVSRGRVRQAADAGHMIPPDWATDAEGNPTTDPAAALTGLMQAIGGTKGANLALSLDLLASGLSGAAMLSEIPDAMQHPEAAQDLGLMFLLFDASRMESFADLGRRIDEAARILSDTPAIDPASPPRLPGARALAALHAARRDGIELSQGLLDALRGLAG